MSNSWRWLCALLIIWPTLILSIHWDSEGIPRLAHSVRMAGCLILAITLTIPERKAFLVGVLLGTAWASSVVIIHHHIISLPAWDIWEALLTVQGNASSQKWILFAAVSGISLWLGLSRESHFISRASLFLIAVILCFLVASYSISRNSHLVLILTPFLILIYRFRSSTAWLIGIFGTLALSLALFQLSPNMLSRFETAYGELKSLAEEGNFSGSASVRAQMLLTGWQQMLDHPFFGTGLGSWPEIWKHASLEYPELSGINNPHNDYILWGMETGIPGLLLLLLMLAKMLLQAWSNNRNALGGAGWVAVWALCLTAGVNAPFRDAAIGMSLLLLAAILATWPSRGSQSSNM